MSRNDVTGDALVSAAATDKFRDGYMAGRAEAFEAAAVKCDIWDVPTVAKKIRQMAKEKQNATD